MGGIDVLTVVAPQAAVCGYEVVDGVGRWYIDDEDELVACGGP